jgi:hypothetical protein
MRARECIRDEDKAASRLAPQGDDGLFDLRVAMNGRNDMPLPCQLRAPNVSDRLLVYALYSSFCWVGNPSEGRRRLMPYVFISHLSDDNLRLGVYVDRLLTMLDNNVDLWIDTPERIKAEFGGNPRVKAIPPGTQWNKEIEAAVENAGCVLAFWSASFHLREDRNVFIREIDRGRKYDCCVQVAIDRKADCNIRAPFSDDQILEIIDIENNAEHEQLFDRVIARVKQMIQAPDRRTPTLPVPVHLLPYLVNRHPQIRLICWTVRQKYGASRENPKMRPSLFVVPCRHYDADNTFGWRLASKDGPEHFGFDTAHDTPDWVKEERILWPPPASAPDEFAALFKTENEDAVSAALKQSRSRGRPVCFTTWIDVAAIEKQFSAFVGVWMQSWPSLLTEASEKIIPERVRLLPQPPIVVLLFIRFDSKRGWLSRWFADDNARVAKYWSKLRKLEIEATYSSAVDFRALEPLALVTQNDATTWLTLDVVMKNGSFYERAISAVDDLFGRPGIGLSMKEFAKRCSSPVKL